MPDTRDSAQAVQSDVPPPPGAAPDAITDDEYQAEKTLVINNRT
jgi:hypothetical protein